MESVNAILSVVLGPAFWLMLGALIGAGVVAFLWLYDIEKPWRPTDDEALRAWNLVTKTDAGKAEAKEKAIKTAKRWAEGWRIVLGEKARNGD